MAFAPETRLGLAGLAAFWTAVFPSTYGMLGVAVVLLFAYWPVAAAALGILAVAVASLASLAYPWYARLGLVALALVVLEGATWEAAAGDDPRSAAVRRRAKAAFAQPF